MSAENDLSNFSLKQALTYAQDRALEQFTSAQNISFGTRPRHADIAASVTFDSAMVSWVAARFMKFAVQEQYSITELLQLQAVISAMLSRMGLDFNPYVKAGAESLAIHALLSIDRTLGWQEGEDVLLRPIKPSSQLSEDRIVSILARCTCDIVASAMAAPKEQLSLVMTACPTLFSEEDDDDPEGDASGGAEEATEEGAEAQDEADQSSAVGGEQVLAAEEDRASSSDATEAARD